MPIRYREFPVNDALSPYVRQIWLLECEGPALFGGPERIVADGVVEAIFHYRRPFRMRFAGADAEAQPVSLLVSQISRYVEIQPAGAGGFVSVRFHPWGRTISCRSRCARSGIEPRPRTRCGPAATSVRWRSP